MLGLSRLSGFSKESSSIVHDVDLELVEQIIERAPRSATTFPLVYKAYGEVLEARSVHCHVSTASHTLPVGQADIPVVYLRHPIPPTTSSC